MPSQHPEQDKKAAEARDVISGLSTGMHAVAAAMEQDPALRGQHVTEHLDKPIKSDFGEFRKKWTYTHGCELGSELLDGSVGAVLITADDKGTKKAVSIGRTPHTWLPRAGGHSLQALDSDAGEPGDYVLEIVRHESSGKHQSFRYLDEADLRGALIRNDDASPSLGSNQARGRQIQISGQVSAVVGFLEK